MKTPFAILRVAKLKAVSNVAASVSHTYRTRETLNADPLLANANQHSHKDPAEIVQALKDRLPEKRRKDAVVGLEFFVGGSPEWFKGKTKAQEDAYFRGAVDWLEKRHGKENVVGWSIHRDESTPHLVAYVVPVDAATGRLNAKKWTGGAAELSRMQTDFARDVGTSHGMARGLERSNAKHQTIKQFYAQVAKPPQHLTISPAAVEPAVLEKTFLKTRVESSAGVADRLTQGIQAAYAPAVEAAKLAASERRRADELARVAQGLRQELERLQEANDKLKRHFGALLTLDELAPGESGLFMHRVKERIGEIKGTRQAAKDRATEQARPSVPPPTPAATEEKRSPERSAVDRLVALIEAYKAGRLTASNDEVRACLAPIAKMASLSAADLDTSLDALVAGFSDRPEELQRVLRDRIEPLERELSAGKARPGRDRDQEHGL